MKKNTNFKYINLSPFKWFVLENFPFLEADFDALTEWQLFCKIGKEINKIITSQNLVGKQAEELTNAFNDLQNYVNNYFNNLDLQEEVNKKLNEMAEDGTLEQIINQNIFSKINNDITLLKNNAKNPLRSTRLFRELTTYDSSTQSYYHAGGFCYIGDGNIVIAKNGSVDNSLSKVQVIRLSDGLVLRETIGKFYHANSICYNKNTNKLYIAPTSIDNTEKIVIELDYLTLNETNRISIDYLIGSICYDNINNVYYAYISNSNYNIACFDSNFNVRNIINLKFPNNFNGTLQSIEFYNNSIYFLTSFPNTIFVFDLEGNFINNIDIDNWIDNAFQVGESEDFSILENGDLYFSSELQFQNSDRRLININKSSLLNNISFFNLDFNQNFELNTYWSNIYVDNTKNIINPTGTKDLPFFDINEAVNFATSPFVLNKRIKINIEKSDTPYNYAYLTANISELHSVTNNADDVKINGLQIRTDNILLKNITLLNKLTDNVLNTPLIIESDSNVKVDLCKFINTLSDNFAIYNQGNIYIYGNTSFTNESMIDIQNLAGCTCKVFTDNAKINNTSYSNNNILPIFLSYKNDNTPISEINSITPYSNNLSFDFIKNAKFNRLRVDYTYQANPKTKEFFINSFNSHFSINDSNINDDIDLKTFELAECQFILTENGIKVDYNYSLSNKDYVVSNIIKINNIYLFN